MERNYSIGEAAKMTGTTIKTVRYYDTIGLLRPTAYTEGGHRLYTTSDLWHLELITTLRYLDFGIDEIKQMINGEIPLGKALDWQIESIETQMNTLANMLSILRQARDHEADSLHYIHDLVTTRAINTEKRHQFIQNIIEESKLLEGIPAEWRSSFLYNFNRHIIHQAKISAKQTVAWQELQELLNDPQFIAELRNDEFLFFNMVHRPHYDAARWVKKIDEIHDRLNTALSQKRSADSPYVQAIVEDVALLYANAGQSASQEDFFRYFAAYSQQPRTERIERFNALCSILSPKYRLFAKGNELLLQGIQWKLKQQQ